MSRLRTSLGRRGRASGSTPSSSERRAPEGDGRFERLADLVIHLQVHQLDRVHAVVGAHEGFAPSAKFSWTMSTILRAASRIVDADADHLGLVGSGGAQHVEARAVAVIDPKAEARRSRMRSTSLSITVTSMPCVSST